MKYFIFCNSQCIWILSKYKQMNNTNNHSIKSNKSINSINSFKMSKIYSHVCPCEKAMFVDYKWKNDELTITISCECGFSWYTVFSKVSRLERQMVRRAIENFYKNHPHPSDCNCEEDDDDDEEDYYYY